MIGPDDYPVYGGRERPGIGRDPRGETFFNRFHVSFRQIEFDKYAPYTFRDFLGQFDRHPRFANTCRACIGSSKCLSFPAGGHEIDRSAVPAKFGDDSEAAYYFCPLVLGVLRASAIEVSGAPSSRDQGGPEPIQAILSGGWDDPYLFEFKSIRPPADLTTCRVLSTLLSDDYFSITATAERAFLMLWMAAAFFHMDKQRSDGAAVFLEDADFDPFTSKLFDFVFPVPQVWVSIIPPPPAGISWDQWERDHQGMHQPERVDFLFTCAGRRHIIELDGLSHYGTRERGGRWVASEREYRKTLHSSRWLKWADFDVHRFTNEEILELHSPGSTRPPDVEGLVRLLRMERLEAAHLVAAGPVRG